MNERYIIDDWCGQCHRFCFQQVRLLDPSTVSMYLSIFLVGNKLIIFRTKQGTFKIPNTFIRDLWLDKIKPAADHVLSFSALLAGMQCTILTIIDSIGKVFFLSAQNLKRLNTWTVKFFPQLNLPANICSTLLTKVPRNHQQSFCELFQESTPSLVLLVFFFW